jgi:hypothetical protein
LRTSPGRKPDVFLQVAQGLSKHGAIMNEPDFNGRDYPITLDKLLSGLPVRA